MQSFFVFMLMAAVGDGEIAHSTSPFSDVDWSNLTTGQISLLVADTTLTMLTHTHLIRISPDRIAPKVYF